MNQKNSLVYQYTIQQQYVVNNNNIVWYHLGLRKKVASSMYK